MRLFALEQGEDKPIVVRAATGYTISRVTWGHVWEHGSGTHGADIDDIALVGRVDAGSAESAARARLAS